MQQLVNVHSSETRRVNGGKTGTKTKQQIFGFTEMIDLLSLSTTNIWHLQVEGNAESSFQKEYHTKRELHKTREKNVVHSLSSILSVQILTSAFSLFLKLEGFR